MLDCWCSISICSDGCCIVAVVSVCSDGCWIVGVVLLVYVVMDVGLFMYAVIEVQLLVQC